VIAARKIQTGQARGDLRAAHLTGAPIGWFHTSRPSDAIRASQRAWISSSMSPGSETVRAIPVFVIFCVERNKFCLAASLQAARAVCLLRKVVLDRCEQKRSEFAFKRVDLSQRLVIKEVQKKKPGSDLAHPQDCILVGGQTHRVDTSRACTEQRAPLAIQGLYSGPKAKPRSIEWGGTQRRCEN
jgi:hypothetical protein